MFLCIYTFEHMAPFMTINKCAIIPHGICDVLFKHNFFFIHTKTFYFIYFFKNNMPLKNEKRIEKNTIKVLSVMSNKVGSLVLYAKKKMTGLLMLLYLYIFAVCNVRLRLRWLRRSFGLCSFKDVNLDVYLRHHLFEILLSLNLLAEATRL